MKVAISICRVSGTAIACLYTLILASFAPSGILEQRIFSSCAVVFFLFPCTMLRANPIVGYSGTVAGFSTALLLLAPLTVSLVLDRLIDTCFGIAIFLVFEVFFTGQSSENSIVHDMCASVEELERSAVAALRDFTSSGTDDAPSAARVFPLLPPRATRARAMSMRPRGIRTAGSLTLDKLKLPSKEVLVFSSLEPNFFHKPSFSPSLLENAIDELVQCHQHANYLAQVVDKVFMTNADFEILPLQEHLESIDRHVVVVTRQVLACLRVGELSMAASSTAAGAAAWVRKVLGETDVATMESLRKMVDERRNASASDDDGQAALDSAEAKILTNFRTLIYSLQKGADGQFAGTASIGATMKNQELVLCCSFLGALQDFLRALRALQRRSFQLRDFHRVRHLLRP